MPPIVTRTDYRLDRLIDVYDIDAIRSNFRAYSVRGDEDVIRPTWNYVPRPELSGEAGVQVECWLWLRNAPPTRGATCR